MNDELQPASKADINRLDGKVEGLASDVHTLKGRFDRFVIDFVNFRDQTYRMIVDEGKKNTDTILRTITEWSEQIKEIDRRGHRLDVLEPRVKSLEQK